MIMLCAGVLLCLIAFVNPSCELIVLFCRNPAIVIVVLPSNFSLVVKLLEIFE